MFCLLTSDKKDNTLAAHQSIFPRPTPWITAWKAFLEFVFCQVKTYQFVYIPAKYMRLMRYDTIIEEDDVILLKDGDEVLRTPVIDMNWQIWILYVIESWCFGLMLRFWNWRVFAGGKLTKQELFDKLERIETGLCQPPQTGN